MIKILFVCHGNICRSPMAEFIFKDMVEKAGKREAYFIASAATSREEIWNGIGNPVYPDAARELASHGISAKGKRAVQIQREDYPNYDYLVCMDEENMRTLKRLFPMDEGRKIFKILSFAGLSTDVADPWYYGNFDKTYDQIETGCRGLFDFLERK